MRILLSAVWFRISKYAAALTLLLSLIFLARFHLQPNLEYLLFHRLPFAEDIRQYSFPSLHPDNMKKVCVTVARQCSYDGPVCCRMLQVKSN